MTFKTLSLKKRTYDMLPIAKKEFLEHHPEWDIDMISQDKIVFEALRYYIGTGRYKNTLQEIGREGEK